MNSVLDQSLAPRRKRRALEQRIRIQHALEQRSVRTTLIVSVICSSVESTVWDTEVSRTNTFLHSEEIHDVR